MLSYKYKSNAYVLILYFTFLLCSCAKDNEKSEELTDPQILFEDGINQTIKGNYSTASNKFELIEREHPSSPLSAEAHIRRAYTYYLDGKFDIAVETINDFIKQHPVHNSTSYMFYLKALCYYDQIVDIGRDQATTYKAITALKEVIARFPDSKYARDSNLKLEYCLNTLAGKEMEIGRFYLNKKQLLAALQRFKTVVRHYETTIFTEEALFRIAEIYYTLGDINQAEHYAATLGYNYPNGEWYKTAYSLIVEKNIGEQKPWFHKLKEIW